MRILMLTEYFFPFDRGGSEWSTFYLAQGLRRKGIEVAILTPDYGGKGYQKWRGLPIYRFWFPRKLFKKGEAITPFWHTNVLWFFITFLSIWRLINKKHHDLIHVQGKYFLPAAIIISKLKKIPIVATIRDYQILCPLGICLNKEKENKKCSFIKFVQEEIPHYLAKYHPSKNIFQKLILFLACIRAKIVSYLLNLCLRYTKVIIVASRKMKQILSGYGIESTVIYNPMVFDKVAKKKKNLIVFAGRLTWGKGAHLLIPSVAKFLKKNYQLAIIGDGFLKEKIRKQALKARIENRVIFTGHLSYPETQNYLAQAKLAICPSTWQEPFGRVALEALVYQTVVVAADRGGLPEIVEDGQTGYVVEPNIDELKKAVAKAIYNNEKLRENIRNKYGKLKKKFYHQPINQHIRIYYSLTDKN